MPTTISVLRLRCARSSVCGTVPGIQEKQIANLHCCNTRQKHTEEPSGSHGPSGWDALCYARGLLLVYEDAGRPRTRLACCAEKIRIHLEMLEIDRSDLAPVDAAGEPSPLLLTIVHNLL